MANVACSISFEDEWKLDGDNCSYNKVFILTYEVPNYMLVNSLESKEFYYKLGPETSSITNYTRLSETNLKRTDTTYQYSFKLTPNQLDTARVEGTLTISTWVKAKYKNITTIYEAKSTQSELIELPPKLATIDELDLKIEQYTSIPGKFKCSWTAPSLYENRPDNEEVNGYCIRLAHNGHRVRNLKLVDGLLVKDSTFKELTYTDISSKSKDELKSFIETNDITFAGPNCSSTSTEADEVYLAGTSFDFVPKDLGIDSGDEYIFTIYPYNNIGAYIIDNGNGTGNTAVGTRLTNSGTICGTQTSKGVVRVKHNNNWKEGQVWVMHNGVWKQAQAVYVMDKGTWKEAK